MLAGIILLHHSPYLITAGIVVLAGLSYPPTLRPLVNYRFWITIGLLVLIVPLFTGPQDRVFMGITYSGERLGQTGMMSLRGISIFLLFQVLTYQLRSERISPLLSKLGISNFDTTFNLSQDIAPRIRSIIMARYTVFQHSWRQQGLFGSVFHLTGSILADFVTLAERLSVEPLDKTTPRPADFLKESMAGEKSALVIVSGDAGMGKTAWLGDLVAALQEAGKQVDGLISEKIVDSDERWHHTLRRISTGETRPLNTMDTIDTPIKAGKFYFYPDAIAWGCDQLAEAGAVGWLVVDELGILEFQGHGLLPGIQKAAMNGTGFLVLSMRYAMENRLDSFLATQLQIVKNLPRYTINL